MSTQSFAIVGEVADAARAHGREVTVIEPRATPLNAVVGTQLGDKAGAVTGVARHLEDPQHRWGPGGS